MIFRKKTEIKPVVDKQVSRRGKLIYRIVLLYEPSDEMGNWGNVSKFREILKTSVEKYLSRHMEMAGRTIVLSVDLMMGERIENKA